MRIVLIVVAGIIALVGGGIAFFPMSMAADMAAKQIPDFKYVGASGSVWDGKLSNVSFGQQNIGDLSVKANLFALFTGKANGVFGLAREGLSGQADLAYGIGDGSLDIKDMKVEGTTGMVPGMPPAVAQADGKFTLQVKELKFTDSLCQTATGEVWTDALTRVNVQGCRNRRRRGRQPQHFPEARHGHGRHHQQRQPGGQGGPDTAGIPDRRRRSGPAARIGWPIGRFPA
jgi:hypothetical protein